MTVPIRVDFFFLINNIISKFLNVLGVINKEKKPHVLMKYGCINSRDLISSPLNLIQFRSSAWYQTTLSLCPVWDRQLETDEINPVKNRRRGRRWSGWSKQNNWIRKINTLKKGILCTKPHFFMVSPAFTQVVLWAQSKKLLDASNLLSTT